MFLCGLCILNVVRIYDYFFLGGRKFCPEITFLPVFSSSSMRAFLAIPPPFLLASLFSGCMTAGTHGSLKSYEFTADKYVLQKTAEKIIANNVLAVNN